MQTQQLTLTLCAGTRKRMSRRARLSQSLATKFDIKRISGENDLRLWRFKIEAILIQQSFTDVIKGAMNLSASLSMKEKTNMINKAKSTKVKYLE